MKARSKPNCTPHQLIHELMRAAGIRRLRTGRAEYRLSTRRKRP